MVPGEVATVAIVNAIGNFHLYPSTLRSKELFRTGFFVGQYSGKDVSVSSSLRLVSAVNTPARIAGPEQRAAPGLGLVDLAAITLRGTTSRLYCRAL
jgi:hypothetical protein